MAHQNTYKGFKAWVLRQYPSSSLGEEDVAAILQEDNDFRYSDLSVSQISELPDTMDT